MSENDRERILVDVTIAAPLDEVWRTLRDPKAIGQWFGWDSDTLKDEIDFIFEQHSVADETRKTIEFGEWEGASHRFEVTATGSGTRVVLVCSRASWPDDWQDIYDDITEGWIQFAEQLRFLLERHPNGRRRTLRLSGNATAGQQLPSTALGLGTLRTATPGSSYNAEVVGEAISGIVWHIGRHQLGLAIETWNDAQLIVVDRPKSDEVPHGGGALTITTFGLAEAEFAAIGARLRTWWEGRYPIGDQP